MGSLDAPFNPVSLAIGAEASFVARTVDSDRKHLTEVLRAGRRPPGHGAGGDLPELQHLQRRRLRGPQGQAAGRGGGDPAGARAADPLRRPTAHKGVVRDPATGDLKVVAVTAGERVADPGPRRARRQSPTTAFALSRLADPDTLHHTPIGVLRSVERPVYDTLMADQLDTAIEQNGKGDLAALLAGRRHLDGRRLSTSGDADDG